MHLTPSDPDIATLYRKIEQRRLDLQPDFQRGEVWGRAKKQRLIDSILRGWHIPPIHIIQVSGSDKQEVLDGQQRLVAIRDFIQGGFPVNGAQDPYDVEIARLDGLVWDQLPKAERAKIEDFTIRVLIISDYKPSEPGELFYRLNQPTNLTSAEQRNAYFGEARQQVKELSEFMVNIGYSRDLIGFSNSRMAYDDVLSKFLLTLELSTFNKKITANTVTSRYREIKGFSFSLIQETSEILEVLHKCTVSAGSLNRLNKATFLSWMLFIARYRRRYTSLDVLPKYYAYFEDARALRSLREFRNLCSVTVDAKAILSLFKIYHDRASSRVSDTSSVTLRDMVIWSIYALYKPTILKKDRRLAAILEIIANPPYRDDMIEEKLIASAQELSWGDFRG